MTLQSAIYRGRVWHVRRAPSRRTFSYDVHMMYLDLDELPLLDRVSPLFGVERAAPASFRRQDYFGERDRDLREEVRDAVQQALGRRPTGPIRLLTQVRNLGYVFNPVSFYYCHAAPGASGHAPLDAVLAEITNTPWGQRFAYVVDAAEGRGARAEFDKRFHVSPFMPMSQRYAWRIDAPDERLLVHMDSREAGRSVFSAGLTMERRPFEAAALRATLLRQPLMSLKVHAAIYAQALALWLRRTPFFAHPDRNRTRALAQPEKP